MSDYKMVSDALTGGADPAMLCMTCPWDRLCIQPPNMTRMQVEEQMESAKRQDQADRDAGKSSGLPVGTLLTALTVAGRDTQSQICPVVALRLGDTDGKKIADGLRLQMQEWGS